MHPPLFPRRLCISGILYLPVLLIPTRSRIVAAAHPKISVSSSRQSSATMTSQSQSESQFPPPPLAKKVKHEMELFGDVRVDNYYWLRDDSRKNPEVLSYLQQENTYTEAIMSGMHIYPQLCICFDLKLYLVAFTCFVLFGY